jgi:hypothetical protein
VNDIWGGEKLFERNVPVWEHDLERGLRMLRLAIDTHLITWMRSEMMLEIYGVTEERWRDALERQPHFAISETPLSTGRAVAALAADPDCARWNGDSRSSGGLAQVYGFTDADGSRPDAWRYIVEVMDAGRPADAAGYR